MSALAGTAGLPFHIPWLGASFGVLIVIVTAAAFTTGNNLFYLLLAVLSATLIVSILANRLNLNRLAVDLRAPQHVFADEPALLDITLTNFKRFLPVFSLTLTLEAPKRRFQDAEETPHWLACYAIVPPRARARQQVMHTFARRGVYALSQLALRTRFPFGLVERRWRVKHAGELIVYPPNIEGVYRIIFSVEMRIAPAVHIEFVDPQYSAEVTRSTKGSTWFRVRDANRRVMKNAVAIRGIELDARL